MYKTIIIIFFHIVSICLPFDQKDIDKKLENEFYLSKNEAIIFVDGLVCPICTYGLKKKILTLKILNKREYNEGVYFDHENQYIRLSITDNQKLNNENIINIIKNSGYKTREIYTNYDNVVDTIIIKNIEKK